MHDLLKEFALVEMAGMKNGAKGPEKVVHDIWQIMDAGVRVGYVGKKPGSPVTLIRRYDDDYRAAVAAFVEKELGKAPEVKQPTPMPPPPAAEQDESDDDAEEMS